MGLTEILLLILGIGAFVASFVLPERKGKLSEQDKKLGEEQIRELVEAQLRDVRDRVSDAADETITYAVEKTERSLERVTNEKIMAVNEYSDTVLEAIHKNHEEVLFLYDMLNDKHDKLKDTVVEVEKKAKETLQKVKDAEVPVEPLAAAETEPEVKTGEKVVTELKNVPEQIVETEKQSEQGAFVRLKPETVPENTVIKEKAPIKEKKTKKAKTAEKNSEMLEVDLSFAGEEGRNNNEKILSLHKAGKSNIAIARELGLGIGEVKLVIDLFKGV